MNALIVSVRTPARFVFASFHGLLVFALLSVGSPATRAQSTTATNRPELVLQTGHTKPISAIALSADGRFLVSASDDNTLKIWDSANGNVLRTLFGHSQPVIAVAVSPDGRLIASGSEDTSVRVWDVVTGEARVLGNHTTPVKEVAFSADGRQLASLGNGEAKLWEVASGREIHSTKLSDDKNASRTQATAGLGMRLDQTAAALTADARLAAIGGGNQYKSGVLGYGGGIRQKPIKVIEVATGREIESFKLKGEMPSPTDLAFSPDGRLLVATFTEFSAAKGRSGASSVIVYEVTTGREVKTFQTGDQYGTGGIAFSPDGKLLASRLNGLTGGAPSPNAPFGQISAGQIKLLDVATWNEVRELKKTGFDLNITRGFTASPLRFSADGKMLAASLGDGVALFDTASGSRLRVLQTTEKASAVNTTANDQAARDQMMQQSGVDSDQLRQIKEMAGGILGNTPFGGSSAGGARIITGSLINFSPDGKLLSSTSTSTTWDVAAGTPRENPSAYNLDPTTGRPRNTPPQNVDLAAPTAGQAVYSPDGKLSASVGTDGSTPAVIIKEVATQRVVRKITIGKATSSTQGVPAQVAGIAFGARGVVVQYCEYKTSGRPSILGGGAASQECHVKTFDANTGQEVRDVKLDSDKSAIPGFSGFSAMSPDGRLLVSLTMDSGGGFGGFKPSFPGLGRRGNGDAPKQQYKIRLTDLDNGRKLWEVKAEGENMVSPPSFTFSPMSNALAVTSYDKAQPVINLYDTASGRKLAALNSSDRRIATMNFSRDGKRLVTTYGYGTPIIGSSKPVTNAGDNFVTIWDATTGQQLRTLTHNTPVSGAAFHPTGKLIATLGQDRNQYLWDVETGEKLATLVNLDVLNEYGRNNEWLVVTPDGLFDGSPAAWQQIMWRFSQNTFDVGPVEIFFNELYYPGLLADIFTGKRPKAPRDLQQIDRRQPKVNLTTSQSTGEAVKSRTLSVKIDLAEAPADGNHAQGSGARDVRLFRNGTLVKLWRGDVLKGQKQTALETTLPIVAGENRLTAYAFNTDNVKSADAFLSVTGSESLRRKGVAYVLAFGVNQYANAQYNLKYAAADATAFADEVKAQQMKLQQFERIEVITLLDNDATKENLLLALKRLTGNAASSANVPSALAKLQQAQPEDAVMIYFAGHGTAQGARFYLVPHDLGYAGSRTALDAEAMQTILAHSVSDLELEAAVEGLDAGQLLLVIDACNSGQALEAEEKRRGPMNSKGLAQLAYEKGLYILTAAQSYQAALEAAPLGHGYLTYALIEEGLKKSMADRAQKGEVRAREWFDYATERVPQMQEQSTGSRLLLEDDKGANRSVQRPRVFYRRESDSRPLIVAKP